MKRCLLALATTLLLAGCHVEQVQLGEVFIVHTPPTGACPRLQWQFVVDARRAISGTLTRGYMPIGRLAGVLNPDDTFRMDIAALTGSGTGTVRGAVTSQGTTFRIDGDAAGPGCDGRTLYLPGGRWFQGNYSGGGG
ncbi:MAG TPA: hypothetical protein VHB27_04130 [Rhodopila sp.]|uniref:hypothetical protein n=1 Tax=Rhodopila sp. TaxID=2480087 RepID=UPI002B5BC556|nr:hypothetical protein [Rhodopila sp.]HVY14391.1 hypothetical protein [Rhodopila sp.]